MRHLIVAVLGGVVAAMGLVVFLWTSQRADAPPVLESPDTTAADTAAVNALRESYAATFTAEDVGGHSELFSVDAHLLRNGNSVLVGREAIRESGDETFGLFDSVFESFSDQVELMGDVGFDQGTFRLTQTPREGGDANVYYGSYILISRKQTDGSWKITRYMWNNRPGSGAEQ